MINLSIIILLNHMIDKQLRFKDKFGEEYDLFKFAMPHYDELQNSVGKTLKDFFAGSAQKAIKVLEIGYGSGITSKIILESDPRIFLVGMDNETVMFAQTEHRLKLLSKSRYELCSQDALEFIQKQPDQSFDAVASAFVIHNFLNDYRLEVLKEIYRVLKPNGIFVNADKIADSDPQKHVENIAWQINQFKVFEKIGKPELNTQWTKHYEEDEKPNRVLIEGELIQKLRDLGFKTAEIKKRWHADALCVAKK